MYVIVHHTILDMSTTVPRHYGRWSILDMSTTVPRHYGRWFNYLSYLSTS